MLNKFSLDYSWLAPSDHPLREYSVTTAKFKIEVGGEAVTFVNDFTARASRDEIFIPLYPLAEWIVTNWWFIFNEYFHGQPDFEHRHNIAFAESGIAFPDLIFSPEGDQMNLRWNKKRMDLYNLEFIYRGEGSISMLEASSELNKLISSVVERLQSEGINDTQLQQQWIAINAASKEEKCFCLAASALGINPYDVSDKMSDRIVDTLENLPENVINDFFQISTIEKLLADANLFSNYIKELTSERKKIAPLIDLKTKMSVKQFHANKEWGQGYSAARYLRKFLKISENPISDVKQLADCLNLSSSQITSIIHKPDSGTLGKGVKAIVATNLDNSPEFVIFNYHEQNQQYALCRGLFEYLFTEPKSHIITSIKTETQKSSKAFAAEFMAPASFLKKRIKKAYISSEDISDLAYEFNLPQKMIEHQIENHRIAELVGGK